MPHSSTWFRDSPASSSGRAPAASNPNNRKNNNNNKNHNNSNNTGDDSSDDIEVASERISIKCPITLLPMRDPLSSSKCPHSFERTAILELISASTIHLPIPSSGGGGNDRNVQTQSEKAMKCPVCEVVRLFSPLFPPPLFSYSPLPFVFSILSPLSLPLFALSINPKPLSPHLTSPNNFFSKKKKRCSPPRPSTKTQS